MKGSFNLWLLVIVVVCALSFWFGKDLVLNEPRSGPSDEVSDEVTTNDGRKPPLEITEPVHLLVLNGTEEGGLAREFGLLLGSSGCVVEKVGNAPHSQYAQSFLVNRSLPQARIDRLAADLGGMPILREFDGRSAADAVLVLGRDHDRIRTKLQQRGF
ncbi:MAG: LytR C-terminal domain-containing protein [Candidatus Krumholzibacteria bacterium]|nr:LytR C-terminal domain-containing protein [Candidatus Krumholzibacteria bacterium]